MAVEMTSARGVPPAEVVNIADLVEYNDGAVVSRTLLKSKAGTITLFAFDRDQGLSEHTAPFDALVQVVDGRGEFTIAGETHQVRVGQAILMPADIPHGVRAVDRLKMLLTMLRR
ncbi:MAG: cupin domain-containing protein [Planctomycetota bacterium]|jgi:quercetin dioxygenase-like cupin family protein